MDLFADAASGEETANPIGISRETKMDQMRAETEAAQLRRAIAEMQASLSWRITAPLRLIARPLFHAMAPKAVPQAAPAAVAPVVPPAVPPPVIPPVVPPAANLPVKHPEPAVTPAKATDSPVCPTLETVSNWYGVNPKFVHAALETFVGADYDRNIDNIHKLLDRYESSRIQLEYAFSTNGRGRTLIQQLARWGVSLDQIGSGHKTYLDIGCAYGGFLIEFAKHGYDAMGIELSGPLYGRLGKLNLEVSGCPASIRIGDFLTDDIVTGEQQFDMITCNDVIEHVSNPETCIHKICRLLKPGGVAYVASPNKLSIPNVRSDVHFQCFGLTLLDYFRARAAYAMYSGGPNYEVSDFYEPEWYVSTAKATGVDAKIVFDSEVPQPDIPGEIAMLYTAFADWAKSGSRKLDPLMRHEITRELANYSARMFQSYSEHAAHNSMDEFAKRWIYSPTQLLVRKPQTPR